MIFIVIVLICNLNFSIGGIFTFKSFQSYVKLVSIKNMTEEVIIRHATEHDLIAINGIYNEAVVNTIASFDIEEKSIEFRQNWYNNRMKDRHVVIVCEVDKEIRGWASLNQWSDRAAYNGTVENSVYIYSKYHGRGYGSMLMKRLVEMAREIGFHTILSRIADGNQISIKLHEKYGFNIVGVTKEVGFKFDRYIDVVMMQLLL
jgi:phosphinothricin acetyltransferase